MIRALTEKDYKTYRLSNEILERLEKIQGDFPLVTETIRTLISISRPGEGLYQFLEATIGLLNHYQERKSCKSKEADDKFASYLKSMMVALTTHQAIDLEANLKKHLNKAISKEVN